jgi:hypothetical protein
MAVSPTRCHGIYRPPTRRVTGTLAVWQLHSWS